ncbi:MAG: hypothetical protein RL325_1427, partial [Planctomycetota bacterium]
SRWWMTRASQKPEALFEPGDWRIDAVGNWLDAFLRGEDSVTISWQDGRPLLAEKK